MFFPYKDDNPRVLVPYVNYGIISLNVFIFIGQTMLSLHDPRINIALINVFGFIPIEFNLLDILTSMFMHGGLFHILGNMWFLWIFGDNVESALGHVRYLGFYLFCGSGAAIGQFFINPSSHVLGPNKLSLAKPNDFILLLAAVVIDADVVIPHTFRSILR